MSLALQVFRDHAGEATAADQHAGPTSDYPYRRPAVVQGRLRRSRRWLPASGEALVSRGQRVEAGTVLARPERAGQVSAIDVAGALGVPPERLASFLVRGEGEMVAEGDLLAERRVLGGLQRRQLRSPVTGWLRHISAQHGNVYIESIGAERQVLAHLAGNVVLASPGQVVIEGSGLSLAGVAGAGPAAAGPLLFAANRNALPAQVAGAVVACAFTVDDLTIRALADGGAVGAVIAEIDEDSLDRLGWDDVLWPPAQRGARRGGRGASAAQAAPPLTVVALSIGAGSPHQEAWEALRALAGQPASALGAEAGQPPELLVMLADDAAFSRPERHAYSGVQESLQPGALVRVRAGPAEGLIGTLVSRSPASWRLASELHCDAAEVAFAADARVRVPLLHLEWLQGPD